VNYQIRPDGRVSEVLQVYRCGWSANFPGCGSVPGFCLSGALPGAAPSGGGNSSRDLVGLGSSAGKTPCSWLPCGGDRADLRQVHFHEFHQLGRTRLAWEQEDLKPGSPVGSQFRRSLVDLQVTAKHRPPMAAHPGKPVLVTRPEGGLAAAVQLGRAVQGVPEPSEQVAHRPGDGVLVSVELRRRGQGGRGRRSGPPRC